ncbi:MAG: energy transducer TonB [Cyclobacteriaceae bacterium]
MEAKKNPKHDLERKHSLFFFIGLMISLTLTISAFEWRTEHTIVKDSPMVVDPWDEEDIIATIHEPPKPPPAPKVVQPIIIESKVEVEEIKEILIYPVEIEIYEPPVIEELPEEPMEDQLWIGIVESMPEPVGGFSEFYKFLGSEIKYPRAAKNNNVQGKVFVQFVVSKDGSLSEIEVVKGIGFGCDDESLRVMKLAPKWTPGKQRGKPVRVRMIVPISFKLG